MALGYGKKPGDMKPEVMDCDYPMDGYAGKQYGYTNMYKERQDRQVDAEAGKLRKENFKGRYE